jgi:magnesium transporter
MQILTYYEQDHPREISRSELDHLMKTDTGVIWVDITGPSPDDIDLLEKQFKFHPLAVEDVQNQAQRPKAEEFANYLFIILNPIEHTEDTILFRELDVFIGPRYIVTVHLDQEPVIDIAKARIVPDRLHFVLSATYLLYVLFDTVVDQYLPVLESLETEIDVVGDLILYQPDADVLTRLFRLKRSLNEMWWVIWPQQDIVNTLMNHNLVFIDTKSQYYLRDVSDHLSRVTNTVQALRETVPSLINLQMSAVSNRLNRAVNGLTIMTIVIGVSAVIGGFYGMNFTHTWPPFDAPWGVPVAMLMMASASLLVYFVLRWRGFIK